MKLKIENFGKIKSADLELEGLTVITGQNDTGKSTVGKIIFWIINSLNNYKDQYNKLIINICKYRLITILKYLSRKEYNLPENLKNFLEASSNEDVLFGMQQKFLDSKVVELARQTLDFIEKEKIAKEDVIKEEFSGVKFFLEADDKLKIEIVLAHNKNEIFKGTLNNSVHSEIKAKISFDTFDTKALVVNIDDNNINVDFNKDKIQILWSNVDFIETPLMVDSHGYYNFEKKWIEKFNNTRSNLKDKNSFFISNEIQNIIDGYISISDDDDLYYQKNKTSKKLHIMNAASGAKSFVVLDLLNKFGNFKSDSITVFDEPENHLHPEWQVKYAELIIDFVQKGANIILTSHSPYMIQALIHYAKKRNLAQEKFRLLLSKKEEENWVVLNNVTKTPQKIFELLDKPFYDVLKD